VKIVSWNVNGLRSIIKKGFVDFVKKEDPDIVCVQEIKAKENQIELNIPNYQKTYNSAKRKGYSGVATFSKKTPIGAIRGFESKNYVFEDKFGNANNEGRLLALEFEDYYVANVYSPNSKSDLTRLRYRTGVWDKALLEYLLKLKRKKSVIFCGDLNVAHKEVDLANPKQKQNTHGFTGEERKGFDNILKHGFVDTFRMFESGGGHYTWWAYWANSRRRNLGWRIDYICVSEDLKDKVQSASIYPDVIGSDHCPIGVVINL